MSKQQGDYAYANERIPSYEESIASQNTVSSTTVEKQPRRVSIQQRNRLKRTSLVHELTCSQIEPAINRHLEDGIGTTIAILVPSNALPSTTIVSTSNITSPALPANTNLLRLRGDDYNSSFLNQPAVVRDLASALISVLVDPTQTQPSYSSSSSSALVASNLPSSSMEPLKEGPDDGPQSDRRNTWKYLAGIPEADKDPTGSTGSWNLGWRNDSDPANTSTTIQTEEVTVSTRLQDITFRIENGMGLLDSANIKCVWCAVELKG